MIENKYDDETFFAKYSAFPRSVHGLKAAGEWHELKKLLPDFAEKRVLDLGCGFGWHCFYAAEHGAKQVLGIDVSEKMLKTAAGKNHCKPDSRQPGKGNAQGLFFIRNGRAYSVMTVLGGMVCGMTPFGKAGGRGCFRVAGRKKA